MPHNCEPDVAIIHHCSNAVQNWRIWCRTPCCQRTPGPARGCRLLATCSLDKPCSAAIVSGESAGASTCAPDQAAGASAHQSVICNTPDIIAMLASARAPR